MLGRNLGLLFKETIGDCGRSFHFSFPAEKQQVLRSAVWFSTRLASEKRRALLGSWSAGPASTTSSGTSLRGSSKATVLTRTLAQGMTHWFWTGHDPLVLDHDPLVLDQEVTRDG